VHGISAHGGFDTDLHYGNYGHLALGVPLPPALF